MRPWLLRPAFEFFFSMSERSGCERVISSNVETDMPRRPGDVGRYVRIGILASSPKEYPAYGCSSVIDSPGARVTMAFFHGRASLRKIPLRVKRVRLLPGMRIVLTCT